MEKTVESFLGCREIKAIYPKGNQPEIFIGRTDAEAETLILWPPDVTSQLIRKDSVARKIQGKRRGQQRMRWLNGITDSIDMGLGDGQESLVYCSPWVRKDSDTTE